MTDSKELKSGKVGKSGKSGKCNKRKKVCDPTGFERHLCCLSPARLNAALVEMRYLWCDHVLYTRLAVEETVFQTSSLVDATVRRLFDNQLQLGRNFAKFYGRANGARYAAILTQHINDAVRLLTALLANPRDPAEIAEATRKALVTARRFARLWACVNPFASEQRIFRHMREHIVTLAALMEALILCSPASPGPAPCDPNEVVRLMDIYVKATQDMVNELVADVRKQKKKACSQC